MPAAPAPVSPAPSGAAGDRPHLERTAGIVEVKRAGAPALMTALRVASHPGYDRVVFEFRDAVPGYHVEYIDRPIRDCGAGNVRSVAGEAWLEVRLEPANAHTEAGQATIEERERTPALPIVQEIELTCDFEAVVTWVIGSASPRRYGVFELQHPPRLVVDIEH